MSGTANKWQPIETHPKDGQRFVATYLIWMDEYDEDDRLIAKNKPSRFECIAAFDPLFGLCEYPLDRSISMNKKQYTHWMPLPPSPTPSNE